MYNLGVLGLPAFVKKYPRCARYYVANTPFQLRDYAHCGRPTKEAMAAYLIKPRPIFDEQRCAWICYVSGDGKKAEFEEIESN